MEKKQMSVGFRFFWPKTQIALNTYQKAMRDALTKHVEESFGVQLPETWIVLSPHFPTVFEIAWVPITWVNDGTFRRPVGQLKLFQAVFFELQKCLEKPIIVDHPQLYPIPHKVLVDSFKPSGLTLSLEFTFEEC